MNTFENKIAAKTVNLTDNPNEDSEPTLDVNEPENVNTVEFCNKNVPYADFPDVQEDVEESLKSLNIEKAKHLNL